MYVIIVYDVGEKRVGKMLKLCRQYLCWIQSTIKLLLYCLSRLYFMSGVNHIAGEITGIDVIILS